VLQAFRADDDRIAAASATIERGPSGLTRVSLSQRRPDGPSFSSPVEPRAWRVVSRPPLPAPPGQAVAGCAAAIRRACEAWNSAGGADALDCAMDHRGVCVPTDDEAYLRRSLEDARERLVAAHRAHDSVATEGARAETEAQLRLERLAAETVAYRAMTQHIAPELVAPLLEVVEQTWSSVRDVRPSEWFPSPAATEGEAPSDAPIPDWLRD
jgi:hypothetical protein